ncbi:hypothetical protein MU448_11555 [Streptococcus sp. O1]|uniref:hypothetical protein n=1 Tax=Streptococcus sp. O1 TaxID=2928735 RepID=UPI00211AA8BC|nr:hypothetical protein [Streptococcus sp. O1]MCQ9214979.1 hypothetical protein [Streptococcus sp. O1]
MTALHGSMLYHHLAHKQSTVIRGIGAEYSRNNIKLTTTVDTGVALITGRMVEITSPGGIVLPARARAFSLFILL